VTAALAKAVRVGLLQRDEGGSALRTFSAEWNDVLRLQLTETLVARAGDLAWEHGLRGYDAVHLAAALFLHETIGKAVTLATFDQQLWDIGTQAGLPVWPSDLGQYLGR
jgi:predicted nucleic acid-binding protein